MKKNTLIICSRRTKSAPRLHNIYQTLKVKYDIFIAGDSKPEYLPKNKFMDISTNEKFLSRLKKIVALISYFLLYPIKFSHLKFLLKPNALNLFKKVSFKKIDLVVLHHIDLLPIIVYLKRKEKFKLIVNIHEYYPKEFNDQNNWSIMQLYWDNLCHEFLNSVDLFLSVNQSISNEFIKNFKVDKRKFILFPNVKEFRNLIPTTISKDKISLVHHGAAIPSRNIELMIKLMDFLPSNFELNLILVERNPSYLKYLKSLKSSQVKFLEPIDFVDIPQLLNKYDIGLYFLKPSNLNEEYSLPNKFFEFIQARLCIAISPVKEMRNLVLKYDLGIVAEDFNLEKFAKLLSDLSIDSIKRYKQNTNKAAYNLSKDFYNEKVLNEIEMLFLNTI